MESEISDQCGFALIRLLKPPKYYAGEYGDPDFLLDKSAIMAKKQRNRGQDGAGFASMILDPEPGEEPIIISKALPPDSIQRLFSEEINPGDHRRSSIALAHVRYGIHGENRYENLHPVKRDDDTPERRLVIAGNCNFANIDHQVAFLRSKNKMPTSKWDMKTVSMLLGHFINEDYWNSEHTVDMKRVMEKAITHLDGGFALVGFLGNGDMFMIEDPYGIRPNFYAQNDDFIVAASEDTPIRAAFGFQPDDVRSIGGGEILTVDKKGNLRIERYAKGVTTQCHFEEVYFSRDTTKGKHRSRKNLGREVGPAVHETIRREKCNKYCVTYIPNTSETAAIGLCESLTKIGSEEAAADIIKQAEQGALTEEMISGILEGHRVHYDRAVLKDEQERTFIAPKDGRGKKARRGYDTVPDILRLYDWLVIVEDSLVKGTTSENITVPTLIRDGARNIMIVSSCPQIRYPCCYGIDMSILNEFIAFRAMTNLLKKYDKSHLLEDVHSEYKRMGDLERPPNLVAGLYDQFEYTQISDEVAEIISPSKKDGWDGKVVVVYQTIDGLRRALGKEVEDACLTGNYPTDGGYRVLRRAFMNFIEGRNERSY
jgi:amidophosphoribosyltransferase